MTPQSRPGHCGRSDGQKSNGHHDTGTSTILSKTQSRLADRLCSLGKLHTSTYGGYRPFLVDFRVRFLGSCIVCSDMTPSRCIAVSSCIPQRRLSPLRGCSSSPLAAPARSPRRSSLLLAHSPSGCCRALAMSKRRARTSAVQRQSYQPPSAAVPLPSPPASWCTVLTKHLALRSRWMIHLAPLHPAPSLFSRTPARRARRASRTPIPDRVGRT
mmetsp:Transcript_14292/g.35550  ORF Transcript_14292/g.35550 Transcript_14292/m.35550 type:complete len:214 (-) Transcript_14292:1857-2498(-)